MRFTGCSILALLCLLAEGCTSVPVAEVRPSYVLSAVRTAQASSPFAIDIQGRSVDHIPTGWASPAAAESRLITGPFSELKAASPSPAETVLIRAAQGLPDIGPSPTFGLVRDLKSSRILVPPGATTIVAIAPLPHPGSTPAAAPLELRIQSDGPIPTLELRSVRPATEDEAAIGRHAGEAQTLRVAWPLPAHEGEFELAIPACPGLDKPTLWAFRVRALSESETEESRTLLASLAAPSAPISAQAPLARAIRDARAPAQTRRALAFAAIELAAPLTSEVAVIIADKSLATIAESAAAALDQPGPDPGWRLESASILALAKLAAAGTLDRPVLATLAARYGEVGRDPSSLASLAKRSASFADFDNRLEAEHLIVLGDSSPAARVRAFDWLSSRSAAPAGYNPLAPARARSDAIDRHMQSMESRR